MKNKNNFRFVSIIFFSLTMIIVFGTVIVLMAWSTFDFNNEGYSSIKDLITSETTSTVLFVITFLTFITGSIFPALYGLITSAEDTKNKWRPITDEDKAFKEVIKDSMIFVSFTVTTVYLIAMSVSNLFPNLNLIVLFLIIIILIGFAIYELILGIIRIVRYTKKITKRIKNERKNNKKDE